MIISARRRTDIPAFYSRWFFDRLAEGYVWVRNPMNRKQISEILLDREHVDCFVFWTKNPAPLMEHLGQLDNMGYPYYFQFTLTPYGRDLEPGLPEKSDLEETFLALAEKAGKDRLVWRYDPIVFSRDGRYTAEYHLREFERLCRRFEGLTDTCTVSFLDVYRKNGRSLQQLEIRMPDEEERRGLLLEFCRIAGARGIAVQTCCEAGLLPEGVGEGRCIDPDRIRRITGKPVPDQADKTQRQGCRCAKSVDIGAYDTCVHFCGYCYANGPGAGLAQVDSPLLSGKLRGDERITLRKA